MHFYPNSIFDVIPVSGLNKTLILSRRRIGSRDAVSGMVSTTACGYSHRNELVASPRLFPMSVFHACGIRRGAPKHVPSSLNRKQ